MSDTPTPYMYAEQSELEAYLGVTLTENGANQFALLLPAIMDAVDQYCNRSWQTTEQDGDGIITEYFDAVAAETAPYANDTFFVKQPKIAQDPADPTAPLAKGIVSVTVGGVPWDMRYVYSYDTHVKLWLRPMTIMLPNPLGFKAVEIKYKSDAAGNVPPLVKQAVIEWIARKIQTSGDANKDPNRVQTGTVQVQFTTDKVGGMPDFVKLALDQYRLAAIDRF